MMNIQHDSDSAWVMKARRKKIEVVIGSVLLCAIVLIFMLIIYHIMSGEPQASSVRLSQRQIDAAKSIIVSSGRRCDTVSGAVVNTFTGGYRINCNDFRYTYDLVDNGGGWEVR